MSSLSDYDRTRYHRQMLLRDWSEAGQLKVKAARVFIAGAGGLGSPVAIYLAVAGVGEIRICDLDTIELSNLNRQILHPDARLGQSKALSAAKTLTALNPAINVIPFAEYLDETNLDRIAGRPDIIVDCLDNYETRYLLNRYCLRRHIPLVHGAIWGWSGQLSFLQPPQTPCLRCLVPQPPPQETFPVVGATAGLVGSLQALETLKYLTGVGELLKNKLLLFDGEEMFWTEVKVERKPDCPDCAGYESI